MLNLVLGMFFIFLVSSVLWVVFSVYIFITESKEKRIQNEISSKNYRINTIGKAVIPETGDRQATPFLEKYNHLNNTTPEPDKRYTNTEFSHLSEEFLKLYDSLDVFSSHLRRFHNASGRNNNFFGEEVVYPITRPENDSNDSIIRTVRNHKKGFDGEKLVKNTLLKDQVTFLESVNLKSDGTHIELDFVIVEGNNIVTLEVKDYSSEEIVLDNSGEIYKVIKGEKIVVENVLSQVNRHKRFIRANFPEGVNIINLIVFADRKATVINNMDSGKLKVVVPDYIVNVVEDLNGKDQAMEKVILNRIRDLLTTEREFDFFNIEKEIQELKELLAFENSPYAEYIRFYSVDEDSLKELLLEKHLQKSQEVKDAAKTRWEHANSVIENNIFDDNYSIYKNFIEWTQNIREDMPVFEF